MSLEPGWILLIVWFVASVAYAAFVEWYLKPFKKKDGGRDQRP